MRDYEELVKVLRDEDNCNVLDYIDDAADAIEELMGRTKVLEKVADKWCEAAPKWISVEERLPKEDQEVFVYLFDDVPYIAWVDGEGQWETGAFYVDVDYLPKWWMPLPEPPKEDDNERWGENR